MCYNQHIISVKELTYMTNKTSTIHLRVEPAIKADVEKLLDRLGLSTTDAINIFLNQIILTGGLPFPVKVPQPKYRQKLKV